MGTVTIGAVNYDVYGDMTGATNYLNGSSSAAAAAWRALTPGGDDQKRTLVDAARVFNRLGWEGAPTTPYPGSQPLAHPRTGLTDRDGNAMSSSVIATDIINGSYELAAQIAADPGVADSSSAPGGNIKSMKAGPASVEFFAPGGGAAG